MCDDSIKTECHESNSAVSREVYIDVIRIVAILGVIMIHVSSGGFDAKSVEPNSYEWAIYAIYNASVRFSVPVFIMITGALYGRPDKAIDLKKLYTNNIFRLLVAMLFWYFVYKIAHTGIGRLWYLAMCISLYMIIPFLRMVTASEKMTRYFMILSLVFSFGVPTFLLLPLGGILPPVILRMLMEFHKAFYESSSFHLGFGLYSYFVLGYVCSIIKIDKRALKKVSLIGFWGFAYTILGTLIYSWVSNSKLTIFLHWHSLNAMMEAIFIFIFIRYWSDRLKCSAQICKILAKVADAVFGVYLVHTVVQHYLSLAIRPLEFNPFWMNFAMMLMIFFCSLFVALMIRKIPFLGKYIV